MPSTVHFELTGRGLLVLIGLTFAVLLVLTGVWFWIGPGYAIGAGVVLVLVVRGAIALVTPSHKSE